MEGGDESQEIGRFGSVFGARSEDRGCSWRIRTDLVRISSVSVMPPPSAVFSKKSLGPMQLAIT